MAEIFQQHKLQKAMVDHFFLEVLTFQNTALCQPGEGQGSCNLGHTPYSQPLNLSYLNHSLPKPSVSLLFGTCSSSPDQEAREGKCETCSELLLPRVTLVMLYYRIMKWFGLEGILKLALSQPSAMDQVAQSSFLQLFNISMSCFPAMSQHCLILNLRSNSLLQL